MKEAKDEEADSLSTSCSLCHMSLDIYQGPARRANTSLKLPVLHLPQLRGLAMAIQAMDLHSFKPGHEQKGHVHGNQDLVYLVLGRSSARFRSGQRNRYWIHGRPCR